MTTVEKMDILLRELEFFFGNCWSMEKMEIGWWHGRNFLGRDF